MSADVHGCLDVFMSESFLIVAPASNKRGQWVCLNPCGVILLKSGYFLQTFENQSFDCHFFNDWKKILYNFGLMIVEMCILTLGLSSLSRLV